MILNEAARKGFISPGAVFVNLLGAAGHLIKHTSFQIPASAQRTLGFMKFRMG
jgi:hypothetical protein